MLLTVIYEPQYTNATKKPKMPLQKKPAVKPRIFNIFNAFNGPDFSDIKPSQEQKKALEHITLKKMGRDQEEKRKAFVKLMDKAYGFDNFYPLFINTQTFGIGSWATPGRGVCFSVVYIFLTQCMQHWNYNAELPLQFEALKDFVKERLEFTTKLILPYEEHKARHDMLLKREGKYKDIPSGQMEEFRAKAILVDPYKNENNMDYWMLYLIYRLTVINEVNQDFKMASNVFDAAASRYHKDMPSLGLFGTRFSLELFTCVVKDGLLDYSKLFARLVELLETEMLILQASRENAESYMVPIWFGYNQYGSGHATAIVLVKGFMVLVDSNTGFQIVPLSSKGPHEKAGKEKVKATFKAWFENSFWLFQFGQRLKTGNVPIAVSLAYPQYLASKQSISSAMEAGTTPETFLKTSFEGMIDAPPMDNSKSLRDINDLSNDYKYTRIAGRKNYLRAFTSALVKTPWHLKDYHDYKIIIFPIPVLCLITKDLRPQRVFTYSGQPMENDTGGGIYGVLEQIAEGGIDSKLVQSVSEANTVNGKLTVMKEEIQKLQEEEAYKRTGNLYFGAMEPATAPNGILAYVKHAVLITEDINKGKQGQYYKHMDLFFGTLNNAENMLDFLAKQLHFLQFLVTASTAGLVEYYHQPQRTGKLSFITNRLMSALPLQSGSARIQRTKNRHIFTAQDVRVELKPRSGINIDMIDLYKEEEDFSSRDPLYTVDTQVTIGTHLDVTMQINFYNFFSFGVGIYQVKDSEIVVLIPRPRFPSEWELPPEKQKKAF
eukprot:Nk52_evm11s317 gene=Nk52_evmTU11s317